MIDWSWIKLDSSCNKTCLSEVPLATLFHSSRWSLETEKVDIIKSKCRITRKLERMSTLWFIGWSWSKSNGVQICTATPVSRAHAARKQTDGNIILQQISGSPFPMSFVFHVFGVQSVGLKVLDLFWTLIPLWVFLREILSILSLSCSITLGCLISFLWERLLISFRLPIQVISFPFLRNHPLRNLSTILQSA